MMAAEHLGQDYNNGPLTPLEQNLILKLVLKHVGRADVSDLKNCRLVCHSWNKAAVEVLEQQHSCAIELDYKKMLDYKALLWNTQLPQMNLAESRDPPTSLRLSLIIHPLVCIDNLSETAKCIQLLMFHPHLRIAFLECDYRIQKNQRDLPLVAQANLELFNLFKLASPNLTSIAIFAYTFDDELPELPYFEEFDFGFYESMAFPKLSSLSCKSYAHGESGILDLAKHLVAVTQLAPPKLTKLDLDFREANEERCTKSMTMIIQNCAAQVEKLEIVEGFPGQTVKILREIKFPKLKTLKTNVTCSFNGFELTNFLNQQCLVLSSIAIHWFSVGIDDVQNLAIAQFPTLANINHLGLYPTRYIRPDDLEQMRWNFATNLTTFPCLNSMGISLGVLLMLAEHLESSGDLVPALDQYPVLSNISSLEVKFPCVVKPNSDLMDSAASAIQIYRHTFPNLRKLVIKPNLYILVKTCHQNICPTIEFLCCQAGLEFLEIRDYVEDWLGQIPKDKHILRGLKCLKLVPLRRPTALNPHNALAYLDEPPSVNSLDFLTRFPALEHLEFGKKSLCKTKIQTIRSGMDFVGRFEKSTHLH